MMGRMMVADTGKTRERPRRFARVTPGLESRTKQSFKDPCDINFIVDQFQATGFLRHVNPGAPTYTDVSNATDLQSAIGLVDAAEQGFMRMPGSVRSACDNDPVRFLEMMSSEDGQKALNEAGLQLELPAVPVEKKPAEETPEVVVPPEVTEPA